MENKTSVLFQLEKIINQRVQENSSKSYVASLNNKGINEILKKIGEESAEVIIAGKDQDKNSIIYESCDLIFHLMVLLSNQGISLDSIEKELSRRFDVSGLEEKANREKK